MKLLTTIELERMTDLELRALFGLVTKGLVMTERHTPERRNGLASLENISRTLAMR